MVLALLHHPSGDSWVPGNRMGPPRKEKRVGAVFCSEETNFRPQTCISPTLLFCGTELAWNVLFLIAFEQEFQGVSLLEAPLHWFKEAPSCSCGLFSPLSIPLPVKCLFALCVGICVCAYALVS